MSRLILALLLTAFISGATSLIRTSRSASLPLPSSSDIPAPTSIISILPSKSISIMPTTRLPSSVPLPSSSLIYPGAIFQGNYYTTSDSAQAVFDWYKSQLQNGFTNKSTVSSQVNGNFYGVIKANSASSSYNITITGQVSDNLTTIRYN